MLNEVKILKELNHPNVMDLVAIYESQNSLYLLNELFDGGEICDQSIQWLPFPLYKSREVMQGIMRALSHLEEKKIMHRDLKPNNIVFKSKSSSEIALVDFGLSAKINDENEYVFKKCGTPGYVAPEILNTPSTEPIVFSTKCDVFSAGLVFYFM